MTNTNVLSRQSFSLQHATKSTFNQYDQFSTEQRDAHVAPSAMSTNWQKTNQFMHAIWSTGDTKQGRTTILDKRSYSNEAKYSMHRTTFRRKTIRNKFHTHLKKLSFKELSWATPSSKEIPINPVNETKQIRFIQRSLKRLKRLRSGRNSWMK